MLVFIIAFIVMLMVVAAMAVGAMMGRKPIAGSCGGIGAAGGDGSCACGRTPGSCDTNETETVVVDSTNFYDASKK